MAWYSAGTVSVTNGNATVTGSGTAWVANAQAGEGIWLPDGRLYEIVSINSDTSLTISPNYLGTTQSGQVYRIVPVKGYPLLAAQQMAALISTVQGYVDGALAGRFGNGTVGAPGISFASNTAMGLYRVAANQLGIATNGVRRVLLSNTAMQVDVPITGSAVQSSKWDDTSGRLMAVGAGGILGKAMNVSSVVNTGAGEGFDDLPPGTEVAYGIGTAGAPLATNGVATAGVVKTVEWNDSSRMQIATAFYPVATAAGHVFTRSRNNGGAWSEWKRSILADDVQSGPYDATEGKALLTGGFGVGGDVLSVTAAALDNVVASGMYRVSDAVAGQLDAGSHVLHMNTSANTAMQIGFRRDSYITKWRRKTGGVWEEWAEIYSNHRIVGTVSESGGEPTGAIIEFGSNANGHYTKFADGTMICSTYQNTSSSGAATWTFPAAFASTSVRCTGSLRTGNSCFVSFDNANTSSVDFHGYGVSGTRVTYSASLVAVGRWF